MGRRALSLSTVSVRVLDIQTSLLHRMCSADPDRSTAPARKPGLGFPQARCIAQRTSLDRAGGPNPRTCSLQGVSSQGTARRRATLSFEQFWWNWPSWLSEPSLPDHLDVCTRLDPRPGSI